MVYNSRLQAVNNRGEELSKFDFGTRKSGVTVKNVSHRDFIGINSDTEKNTEKNNLQIFKFANLQIIEAYPQAIASPAQEKISDIKYCMSPERWAYLLCIFC